MVSDTSWPGYTEVPREVMQGLVMPPGGVPPRPAGGPDERNADMA